MPWFAKLNKAPSASPFWQVGLPYLVRRKYPDNDRFIIVGNFNGDTRTVTKDEATACFGPRYESDWEKVVEDAITEGYKNILKKGS